MRTRYPVAVTRITSSSYMIMSSRTSPRIGFWTKRVVESGMWSGMVSDGVFQESP